MSETLTITEEEIAGLVQQIEASSTVPRDINFCSIWPGAKEALELLRSILDGIPGVGPFAKVAITIVITAGDAAYSALCRS